MKPCQRNSTFKFYFVINMVSKINVTDIVSFFLKKKRPEAALL